MTHQCPEFIRFSFYGLLPKDIKLAWGKVGWINPRLRMTMIIDKLLLKKCNACKKMYHSDLIEPYGLCSHCSFRISLRGSIKSKDHMLEHIIWPYIKKWKHIHDEIATKYKSCCIIDCFFCQYNSGQLHPFIYKKIKVIQDGIKKFRRFKIKGQHQIFFYANRGNETHNFSIVLVNKTFGTLL